MITTGLFVDERNWLMCDVAKGYRTLFTFRLLELHGDESDLDRNRFIRFCRAQQTFGVRVPVQGGFNPALPTQITWINEHCEAVWSLTTSVIDMNHIFADFSFADAWEASFFALTHGGTVDQSTKSYP